MIDTFRKVSVYFLRTKDQLLEKFLQFNTMAECEVGKKLTCLCLDNYLRGEYTSKEFNAYKGERRVYF